MLNINERKTKNPRHRCETNWEERNGLYFRSPLTSPSEGLNCVQIDRSSVRSNIQYNFNVRNDKRRKTTRHWQLKLNVI